MENKGILNTFHRMEMHIEIPVESFPQGFFYKLLTGVLYCYILFIEKRDVMHIIIQNSSQIPIYEQITRPIKDQIAGGELQAGAPLPSVRALAKELKISALTVKKAYDGLEQEGFVTTVHGKGSFVAGVGKGLLEEEARKELEHSLEEITRMAVRIGVNKEELKSLIDLFME